MRGDLGLLLRLLGEGRAHWPHVGALFVLGLVGVPLTLLLPLPAKIALDHVLGDRPLPPFLAFFLPDAVEGSSHALLLFAVGLLLGVTILRTIVEFASKLLRIYVGENLVLRFRARLLRQLQRLSLAYHDRSGVAASLYRIQYDARAIEEGALEGTIPLISAALTLAAMLYVTLRLDTQLAIVALSVTPALFVLARLYRRRLRDLWNETKQIESSALGAVEEGLASMRIVKAFGQEARESERFERRSHEGIRARLRAARVESVFGFLLAVVFSAGTAAVLYLGVQHVRAGALSLGDFVLVLFYLTMLYGPLGTISRKIGSLQSALASADRAFAVLDETPEVEERPAARPLVRARGAVVFDRVSFDYGEGRTVLDDVSLDVPAGSLVGIAGEIGAGKTTLLSLLPRFYDPTAGRVLLDGVDVRDYRLRDLRSQFAIVPQETILLSASIAENIAYGRPKASDEEIVAAAAMAGADGLVRRLPQGYETVIGEGGRLLSRGQRQLVSLARAFLKDAPLLILDEATSALDPETEAVVMEALLRLVRGRTAFMISHRLHTLDACDRIVFLSRGRLVCAPEPVAGDA